MKQYLWPDIDNFEDAKKIGRQGAYVAFFISIVTGVITFLHISGTLEIVKGIGPEAYLDAVLFLALGIGIWRYSRISAVAALLLYVAEQVYMFYLMGPRVPIMQIFITLAFVATIRACFAYHEFKKTAGDETVASPANAVVSATAAPSVEEPKKPNWRLRIQLTGAAILLVIGIGFFILITVHNARVSSSSSPSSESISGEIFGGGGNVYRLKSGETIEGKVIYEDSAEIMLETAGGDRLIKRQDLSS